MLAFQFDFDKLRFKLWSLKGLNHCNLRNIYFTINQYTFRGANTVFQHKTQIRVDSYLE